VWPSMAEESEHPIHLAMRNVEKLLGGMTVEEFRVIGVQALRLWRRSSPSSDSFSVHGEFAASVLPLLGVKRGMVVDSGAAGPFFNGLASSWMQPVIDFLAWIAISGLAMPLYDSNPNVGGYAVRYRLTSTGARFLDADEDHPLLPGFVERVVKRCKDLPDEVAAHLADAQTCAEHGLGRPAIVLAGLAYEAAEDAAVEFLETAGKLKLRRNAKAAEKISEVKKIIPTVLTDIERRSRAETAWDFADRLRERRNQGSHPGAFPDFSDMTEVHELLLSAGRNLPGLWSVRQ
jgi:hypothetical protein